MRQLAWVQLFTWFGLFCMWIYFSVAVARSVFGATDEKSALFTQGVEWGGVCFAVYNGVCLLFSFALIPLASRFSPKIIHTVCLVCGAVGLVSVAFIGHPYLLLLSMAGVGVAWASIVSMPYAMLSGVVPENKMGVYMGIFNFFIVIPQIVASLGLGWVMSHWLNNDRMLAVVIGGVSLGIAALLTPRVGRGSSN
jgi:maltose/moltooligosaccharide transporter